MKSILEGIRVIELTSELGGFAGKLLADMGADLIVVEPPEGAPTRQFPPFVDDTPNPERSLYWWHYNTSKRGVTLDLETESDRERLRKLIAGADVLVAGDDHIAAGAAGIVPLADYDELHQD